MGGLKRENEQNVIKRLEKFFRKTENSSLLVPPPSPKRRTANRPIQARSSVKLAAEPDAGKFGNRQAEQSAQEFLTFGSVQSCQICTFKLSPTLRAQKTETSSTQVVSDKEAELHWKSEG